MSHTPPVDSKGAAIDELREKLAATKTFNYNVYGGVDAFDNSISFEEALDEILALLAQEVNKARIDENQIYLDRINNYKPEPGQLTAASFGSAGAAMETSGWKHAFEDRIKDLERLG